MGGWWQNDIVDAQKWPLMLTFIAFVTTFLVTRAITRFIRAGHGPFHDHVTQAGTHVHHSVPGIILLVVGAFIAVGSATPDVIFGIAAVMIGVGVSLVLDEFALILHLQDVYWSDEGRLSINLVSLTAAYLGLVLTGLSPVGVNDVGSGELAVRLGTSLFVLTHGTMVLICVLKAKYRVALFGLLLPMLAIAGALRLARPRSIWARRRYGEGRLARAQRRTERFDERWGPLLARWDNLVGGAPSKPDPTSHEESIG
jgi:hypothetical protein